MTGKMNKGRLPRGVIRAVSGIVEDVRSEPYCTIVSESTEVISPDVQSERVRLQIIIAVQLSVSNNREWSFDRLQRRYNLPCSISYFKKQKYRYIREIAKRCGFME